MTHSYELWKECAKNVMIVLGTNHFLRKSGNRKIEVCRQRRLKR